MNRRTILQILGTIGATTLLSTLGCQSRSTTTTPAVDVARVAQEITNGVGIVQKTSVGTKGPVVVFEEVHTSRVGQLQIATMLVRLHDHHGLKKIGLEGSIWSGSPLQGKWYQSGGAGQNQGAKEDIAVRMVSEGETSSSELMAMLFPDVEVYGIEDASQYEVEPDIKGSPEIEYLLEIAEKSLTPLDAQKVQALLKQKKEKQAVDYMLNADPWVSEQYGAFKNSSALSAEKLVERLHGLQAKAEELSVQVPAQAQHDMENEIHFFETASQRSSTMVSNTLRLAGAGSGAPMAMIVGAAHADKVVALLAQQSVSFALIRPVDLDSKYGSMSAEAYDRKVKGQWARNTPGTLGYVLNSHKKPPPVIERPTGQSYASMNLSGLLLARAASSGGSFPDNVWPQISNLPGLRIDKDSITRDGNDVIFRAWLKQDDGSDKEVWARVGIRPPHGNEPDTLEGKLIAASEELKAEGGGGGDEEPPGGSGKDADEGPGDIRRGHVVFSRIGMDTLIGFGATRKEVMNMGSIGI